MYYLDKQHPTPIYLQLKELLQNQIEQGVYFPNQKLPSERDLCKHYKLSRMTARRALQELIDEGLAYTRIGKGTFVSKKINFAEHHTKNLSEDVLYYYKKELDKQLLNFDYLGIEQTISEALTTLSAEVLALEIFPALINLFEQRWHHGEVNLLVQRFAITTLQAQLIMMMNNAPLPNPRPKLLLVCAPDDQHEIGLLLLAFVLRQRGFTAIYLGQNVALAEFQQIVEMVRPDLICSSAATTYSAQKLADFSQQLYQSFAPSGKNFSDWVKSFFAFGGTAFNQDPALISQVAGLYLGRTIKDAVSNIERIVQI